jgi:hypothetical protein
MVSPSYQREAFSAVETYDTILRSITTWKRRKVSAINTTHGREMTRSQSSAHSHFNSLSQVFGIQNKCILILKNWKWTLSDIQLLRVRTAAGGATTSAGKSGLSCRTNLSVHSREAHLQANCGDKGGRGCSLCKSKQDHWPGPEIPIKWTGNSRKEIADSRQ